MRPSALKRLALWVAACLVLGGLLAYSLHKTPVKTLVGHTAPAVVGTDLNSGRSVNLSLAGSGPVLVNFFASWCTSCKTEAAWLAKFEQSHPEVTFVTVAWQDERQAASNFLRGYFSTFSAYPGAAGRVIEVLDPGRDGIAWGISAVPDTFAVLNGVVTAALYGPITSCSQLNQLAVALAVRPMPDSSCAGG